MPPHKWHVSLNNNTRRAALEEWKQKRGSEATYGNLIEVFERAGYEQCADFVRNLISTCNNCTEKSRGYDDHQTSPSPPLPPQLPEFPESAIVTAVTVELEPNKCQEISGIQCILTLVCIHYAAFKNMSSTSKIMTVYIAACAWVEIKCPVAIYFSEIMR